MRFHACHWSQATSVLGYALRLLMPLSFCGVRCLYHCTSPRSKPCFIACLVGEDAYIHIALGVLRLAVCMKGRPGVCTHAWRAFLATQAGAEKYPHQQNRIMPALRSASHDPAAPRSAGSQSWPHTVEHSLAPCKVPTCCTHCTFARHARAPSPSLRRERVRCSMVPQCACVRACLHGVS